MQKKRYLSVAYEIVNIPMSIRFMDDCRLLYAFLKVLFGCLLFFIARPATLLGDNTPPLLKNASPNPELSKITFPVSYSLKELMQSLDAIYAESLYEDYSFSNDNLKVFSYKTDNILVKSIPQGVQIQVPVRIEVSYLVKKIIDVNLYLFKKKFDFEWIFDFSFDIFVTYNVNIAFDDNLRLKSEAIYQFEWLTYPYFSIGPLNFRVTKIV